MRVLAGRRDRKLSAVLEIVEELLAPLGVPRISRIWDGLCGLLRRDGDADDGIPFGLAGTPPEFARAAAGFARSYLGGPASPVPFGGRQAVLEELEGWLHRRAEPYALLTAPAGRGKSAVLVRFAQRLAERDGLDLVFLPISIRFGTGDEALVLRALGDRLARILGGDPAPADASISALRVRAAGLLERAARREGRLTVLIVDGLDEAAGRELERPGLWPDRPGSLRVLASARAAAGAGGAEAWRRRLSWPDPLVRTVDLPPLAAADIADLLRETSGRLAAIAADASLREHAREMLDDLRGFVRRTGDDAFAQELAEFVERFEGLRKPDELLDRVFARIRTAAEGMQQLAGDSEVAERLFELTEGEPLLLQYYVLDLIDWSGEAAGDRAGPVLARLAGRRPGYEAVFEDWLADERRRIGEERHAAFLKLLAVFAAAEGPIPWPELCELHDRFLVPGHKLPREHLSGLLGRLVAETEAGLVLQHPKIGEFLREWFGRAENPGFLEDARRAFTDWLAAVLEELAEGSRRPEDVPAYLARHALAHARTAPPERARERIRRLLDADWEAAVRVRLGSEAAWLRHVEAVYAWAAAQPLADSLPPRLRASLILSSLRARGRKVPDRLLTAALRQGVLGPEDAEAVAGQRGGARERVHTLIALAEATEDPARRRRWLEQASATAQKIVDEWERAEVLAVLAPHLPEDVLAAARNIGDEWVRASVLAALAPHLPEEVLAAAREIGDEWRRAEVLAALAPHLPEDERPAVLAEALAAAREIGEEWKRARVLAALAPHLPEEVLAAAREIGDEGARAEVLAALAPHLPEDVLAAAREIGDELRRAELLAALALHLPEDERPAVLAEALATAREIEDERRRARVLAALALHLPEDERPAVLAEALAAAREIGEESPRARVLAALAPHLSAKEREEVLAELIDLGAGVLPRPDYLERLAEAAPAFVALGAQRPLVEAVEEVRRRYP